MVPQAWVVVRDIPLLKSEKMNRVLVKKFVEGLKKSTAAESRQEEHNDDETIEKRLRDIWSQALDIDRHENNMTEAAATRVDQSFSALGGDSFSAMSLVARCRAESLVLTVQDLLSDSSITIRRMVRMVKMHPRSASSNNASVLVATLKVRPVWWGCIALRIDTFNDYSEIGSDVWQEKLKKDALTSKALLS